MRKYYLTEQDQLNVRRYTSVFGSFVEILSGSATWLIKTPDHGNNRLANAAKANK
jgi:hypothetical protein